MSLNVFYPPLFTERTQDYGNANHGVINNAIDSFDWEKAFSVVNVQNQVKSGLSLDDRKD